MVVFVNRNETTNYYVSVRSAWSDLFDSGSLSAPLLPSSSRRPNLPFWVSRISEQLLSRLEHSRKRPSIRTLSYSERKTPKRPRRVPAVTSIASDSDDIPSTEQADEDQRPASGEALKVDNPPAPVNMRRFPGISVDSHSREMRVQHVSKVIDLDDLNYFVNFLEKFARKPGTLAFKNLHPNEASLQVTSNLSYLIELREKVVFHAGQGAIEHISPSLLATVVSILETRISASLRVCNIGCETPGLSSTSAGVRLGLVASSIVLAIICAPESPRVLLVEELLDKIVGLLRAVSAGLIYPSYDPLYRSSRLKSTQKRGSQTNRPNAQSSKAKRDDCGIVYAERSNVSRKVDKALFDSCCSLYDSLTALFLKEDHLPDSFVTGCASACLESLSVTGIARLHIHAVRALCAMFLNYTVHRLWILDNVVREVACIVPSQRRHLRCFQLPGERTEIRVSSALIAELLCLASIDNEEVADVERKPNAKNEHDDTWSALRRKRHDRAAKMAAHVWESFLKYSFAEKESESRASFQALFEDILVLYGRPEWPSAELMLQTISVSLISKMRAEEEKSAYLRAFSIEVLGALATKMCDLYGNQVVRGAPHMVSLQPTSAALEQEREKLLVFLDPSKSLLFKAASSFYEALFVTDDHGIVSSIREEARRVSSQGDHQTDSGNEEDVREGASVNNGEIPADIFMDVEKVALSRAKNVARRKTRKEQIDKVQAVAAARYVGVNRCFAKGFQTILDAILDGMQDSAPTVRAKSIKALSLLDEACHGILRVLPNVLLCIEASCRDVSTLARDAALDLLSRSLLPYAVVGDSDRIPCDVTQVQQSAEDRELFQRIFSIVEKRLFDTSTSVRKRAVAIMRSVMSDALKCCESSSQRQRKPLEASNELKVYDDRIVQICTSLVARLDDSEASVREASERTLRLGLFGFDVSRQPRLGQMQDTQAVALVSHRLTALFMRLPINSHHSFMSRIFQNSIVINQKPFLTAIVNAAVDRLHDSEAVLAGTSGGKKLSELSPSEVKEIRTVSTRRVACCSVLRAFSGLDPRLLASHCRALAPSIKGVLEGAISETDLACVQRILNVLELGVGNAGDWDIEFLEEVMHDVELLVCQSPVQVLEEAAVRCLCVVTKKAETPKAKELLLRVAGNFMKFLKAEKESMKQCCRGSVTMKPSALERNARVALVRLGLLIRYGDFEEEFVSEVYATLESICAILCVTSVRDVLAKSSVRALSHILIKHRYLLSKGTRVLLSAMEGSNPFRHATLSSSQSGEIRKHEIEGQTMTSFGEGVQLCVLQGFHELLRDEEERNSAEKKQSLERNDCQLFPKRKHDSNVSKDESGDTFDVRRNSLQDHKASQPVLAAEEDAEAGYLALSAQAMIPKLEEAVHSAATAVRRKVANILGLLVRQGLVLPATVIPCLFCLLLDHDPRCREYSYRVVSFLADRHSDMLASAALPGLRRCFQSSFLVRYSFRPVEVPEQTGAMESVVSVEKILRMSVDEKSGQSLLSQAIMAMRRDQRRGVLESLIREFDPRVSLRIEAPNGNSPDIHVQQSKMDDDKGQAKVVSGNVVLGDKVDDDDDIGPFSSAEVDIVVAEKLCSLPVLYFFAMTLATLDYTDGAGIGGSLTQGGGTAAADAKLKCAREDVSDLVGIATRIISNSGQATLRVAKQVMRQRRQGGQRACPRNERKISLCASRISLLLLLKNHLKVTRWKPALDVGESDVVAPSSCRMPSFCPSDAPLQVWMNQSSSSGAKSEEQMNDLLVQFLKLMREDAIDESDLAVPSRASKGGRGSWKRTANAKRTGKRIRRKQETEAASDPRKERPSRQAAQNAAKKLSFHGALL